MARTRARKLAEIVDLAEARSHRRLSLWRQKVETVLDANRRAVGRLHGTGALFTHEGARIGRDLLLAHQHLLKIQKVIDRLSDEGDVPAPRNAAGLEAAYAELEKLLDRASALTTRTGSYLARLRTDERT